MKTSACERKAMWCLFSIVAIFFWGRNWRRMGRDWRRRSVSQRCWSCMNGMSDYTRLVAGLEFIIKRFRIRYWFEFIHYKCTYSK